MKKVGCFPTLQLACYLWIMFGESDLSLDVGVFFCLFCVCVGKELLQISNVI